MAVEDQLRKLRKTSLEDGKRDERVQTPFKVTSLKALQQRTSDSIPDEEYRTKVRLTDDEKTLIDYVTKRLEAYANEYEQAAVASSGSGSGLEQITSVMREAGCSDVETTLAEYFLVQRALGKDQTGSLDEVKAILEGALEKPWYKRLGLGSTLKETLMQIADSISKIEEKKVEAYAKERARREYDLSKEQLAARETADKRAITEAEQRTAEAKVREEETKVERLKREAEADKRAEEKKVERTRLEAEAAEKNTADQARKTKARQLETYKTDLRKRVIDLETIVRHNMWGEICKETEYIITEEGIRKEIELELTQGNNLLEFPVDEKMSKGKYFKEFIEAKFGSLVARRLARVEQDKDTVMMQALENMYQDLTKEDHIPPIETLTLEHWINALGSVRGGFNEHIIIYEMAIREDERLKQSIDTKISEEKKVYQERADEIHRILKKHNNTYSLEKPSVNTKGELDAYLKKAKAVFKAWINPNDLEEKYKFHNGTIIKINGKNSTNIAVPGVYQIIFNDKEKHYCIERLDEEMKDKLSVDGRLHNNTESLSNSLYYESKLIPLTDLESFLNEMGAKKQKEPEVQIISVIEEYHPHLDIEFKARERYNTMMLERFKKLEEERSKKPDVNRSTL